MARDGEAFLRLGGFELQLTITGAEGMVIGQEFPGEGTQRGPRPVGRIVGLNPSPRCADGKALLVQLEGPVPGRARERALRAGPDGPCVSCATHRGVPGRGTQALYAGADAAQPVGRLFGAGYVPAWLNPDRRAGPDTGTGSPAGARSAYSRPVNGRGAD